MRIHLIAAGTKMESWIAQGFEHYNRRLPAEIRIKLVEIPIAKRVNNVSLDQLRDQEGRKMLAAAPKSCVHIALDVKGEQWSTETLSRNLSLWMQQGDDVAMYIGGPDGLSEEIKHHARQLWSLSRLTLPHAMVRVIFAEQIYRAWCILNNHPYHRG